MWTPIQDIARNYTVNDLNQYLSAGPASFAYDANGNLTSDGTSAYVYDAENRLVSSSASGGTTLSYDPLGRLWKIWSQQTGTTSFVYEGDHVSAEYDATGAMARRYFWGPGADEPIIQDEGGALNCGGTRFLHANHQGSIIAASNCDGNLTAINRYDEYGIPQGTWGRFQYTGQAWLPELGMYYYKARIYSATLGRFLQTDPIGYDDQVNLYAYVGNDPVNGTDPTGMESYMVARRLDSAVGKARFGHAYIVVDAKYPGDPNAKVISFGELANGSMGNVNDRSKASDFSRTTHASDSAHWRSLGKDDTGSFSRIDARDSTVSAVAGAVRETGDYDMVPGPDLFGGSPAVNSNSAAMGVAQRSTEISGGDRAKSPTGYALPGVNEDSRVQFDQKKLCASDRIACK